MKKVILFFLLIVGLRVSGSNSEKSIDSLKVLVIHAHDTSKIRLLNDIASIYFYYNLDDSAFKYAKASIKMQKRHHNLKQYVVSSHIIAFNNYIVGNYDSALSISNRALELAIKINDKNYEYLLLRVIANTNNLIGKKENALDCFLRSLLVAEALMDSLKIAETYSSIGIFYANNNNLDLALHSHRSCLTILLSLNEFNPIRSNQISLATAYSNLGGVMIRYYTNKLKPVSYLDSAILYFNDGIEIIRKTGDGRQLLLLLVNTSDVYNIKGDYLKAIDLLMEGSDVITRFPNAYLNTCILINLGDAYRGLNSINVSFQYLKKAIELAKENNLNESLSDAFHSLSKSYEKISKYEDSFNNFRAYSDIKDSLLDLQNSEVISEMLARYETAKKDAEISILTKDGQIQKNEIEKNNSVRNIVSVGLLLIVALSFLLLGKYRISKNLNIKMDNINSLVYNKNRMVMDSIEYAHRIQQLIFPPFSNLNRHFSDSLLVYLPKDVISGDIYWFKKRENVFLLTAIDCTGHGVPGALMSMVAYNLLNRAVSSSEKTEASSVITKINTGLQSFLANRNDNVTESIRDGMDIAVCCIDLETLQLNFSGAQSSIYIVRQNELTELKGVPISMGEPSATNQIFSDQSFELKKGDWVYLFTDGFVDQKGGLNSKKFYYKPFQNLIISISNLKGSEQKKNLEKAFNDWKGKREQLDDVLVFGVQI